MKAKIEVLDAERDYYYRCGKVSVHRRKTRDKVYESPRITLPSAYKDLIGRRFRPYRGHARITEQYHTYEDEPKEKEVLILALE